MFEVDKKYIRTGSSIPVVVLCVGKQWTFIRSESVNCTEGIELNFEFHHYKEYVPPKVKKSGWINIYKDGLGAGYTSEEDAIDYRSKSRKFIACVHFEWEE